MNRKIPFEPRELNIVGELPGFLGRPGTPLKDVPVSTKENGHAMYSGKHPYWMQAPGDSGMFSCQMYNQLLGRGWMGEGTVDAFGIEWVWVDVVGGSIVAPGSPLLEDANDWREKIIIPDIDAWDWAGAAELVKVDKSMFTQMSLVNGFWFERLISFMDFEGAAVAVIDEEQKPAVHELFDALTDLACRVVDKFVEYWPGLDGFNVHDDWGSQRAPFFSYEVAEEMFLPYIKRLTDHIHSKGRVATLHSCGHLEDRIQIFIDGGFDQWTPQAMNDTKKLYDKYGDQIVIAVIPDEFDPETTSEEEQRQLAREFVEYYCQPGKLAIADFYAAWAFTPAFAAEVYTHSRKRYLGEV
ncbi:MAG: methyltransferase [Coriobacteriia bacterium]|nr:methyltransferase [Coriobacteriia bacterium]